MWGEPRGADESWSHHLRRVLVAKSLDGLFTAGASLGRHLPLYEREHAGLTVLRDLAYAADGGRDRVLDIYVPPTPGPWPVALYVHGGSFRILSKDSHWVAGTQLARAGFLTFNISYRRAPRHPFPAALEDVAQAHAWVLAHASEHGGDPTRLVLAGESAGANLVTALALACCLPPATPLARDVFAREHVPLAVLAWCGIHEVSRPERYLTRRELSFVIRDRIETVSRSVLPHGASSASALADPLRVLESDMPVSRALPAFHLSVGSRDPIADDTRRLAAALGARRVHFALHEAPGEGHAFQLLLWRRAARDHWAHTGGFLRELLEDQRR